MSDFTGTYDQFYDESRSRNNGKAYKCDFAECDKSAVFVYNSRKLCVDHYRELKG